MANIKSAEKRNRQSQKSRLRNRAVSSTVLSCRQSLYDALGSGDKAKTDELHRRYCSLLDKAVKKGIMKSRTASRRKSRTARRIAAAAKAAQPAA